MKFHFRFTFWTSVFFNVLFREGPEFRFILTNKYSFQVITNDRLSKGNKKISISNKREGPDPGPSNWGTWGSRSFKSTYVYRFPAYVHLLVSVKGLTSSTWPSIANSKCGRKPVKRPSRPSAVPFRGSFGPLFSFLITITLSHHFKLLSIHNLVDSKINYIYFRN